MHRKAVNAVLSFLKKLGDYSGEVVEGDRISVKWVLRRVLELPVIMISTPLLGLISLIMSLYFDYKKASFSHNPSSQSWRKALAAAKKADFSETLFPNAARHSLSNTKELISLLKDEKLLSYVELSEKVSDEQLCVFLNHMLENVQDGTAWVRLHSVCLIYRYRDLFAGMINRTNDWMLTSWSFNFFFSFYSTYVCPHLTKPQYQELYNALYYPVRLARLRAGDSYGMPYDIEFDTMMGSVYACFSHGMEDAEKAVSLHKYELLEEYRERFPELSGLPEGWIMKAVKAELPERAVAYEREASWYSVLPEHMRIPPAGNGLQ